MLMRPQSFSLHCHWASEIEDGELEYYGKCLREWSVNAEDTFREGRRAVHNVINWIQTVGYEWLLPDMETLEATLNQPIPPVNLPKTERLTVKRSRSLSSDRKDVRVKYPPS